MKKGWILLSKIEMTKLWHQDAFIAVTIVKLIDQKIIRVKTIASDWYNALVVGALHRKENKEFSYITEFRLDDAAAAQYADKAGLLIDATVLEGKEMVNITGTSKGKGFQGAIKRHNLTGNFATHGHKFTRVVGSMGNRKPRRTMKWHPAAGHMGVDTVTIKRIAIVSTFVKDDVQYLCLKGSVPGWRNNYMKAFFN